MKKLLILFNVVFSVAVLYSQVFVKSEATGLNNGTSWQNAFTNLDSAINKTNSGQIWAARGVYKSALTFPGYDFKTFLIDKSIALY